MLQTRTVRTNCATDYRVSSKPLFRKFGIFEIYSLPLSFQNFISNRKYKSIIILLDMPVARSYNPPVCRTNMKRKWDVFYKLGPRNPRFCDFSSQLLAFYIFKGKTGVKNSFVFFYKYFVSCICIFSFVND